MNTQWSQKRLIDLGTLRNGMNFNRHQEGPGIPVLKVKDFRTESFVPETGLDELDPERIRITQEQLLQQGDVVIIRSNGNIALVGRSLVFRGSKRPVTFSGFCIRFRPDTTQVDPGFAAHFIRSPICRQRLSAYGSGTGIQNLSQEIIGNVPIDLPPLPQQRRIANLLGTLDEKIELNRQTNETLEAMARRLFRSWFIDFDPVHAKAAVRKQHPKWTNAQISRAALANLAPEIAELFPDDFEDSTLGLIPAGWRTQPLYDIARFVNGAAFKNSDFCDPAIGKPVIKIAELKSGITTQTKFSRKDIGADREISQGDLLYSWSGSPDTSLATFRWTGRDGLLNQHIFKVITDNRRDKLFAYYQLTDLRQTLIEIARNKQTTGLGHVTVEDMKRLHVVHPTEDVLDAFTGTVGSLFDLSFNLEVDSLTLTDLRDKLLPRLLSGELTV